MLKPLEQSKPRIVDLVSRMYKDGSLQSLIDAGLVSPKVLGYFEMYCRYDINMKVYKMKSNEAKLAVCCIFKLCDKRTVSRAVEAMTKTWSGKNCVPTSV